MPFALSSNFGGAISLVPLRGFARPDADLGADSGADFIFERRGIVGRLASGHSHSRSSGNDLLLGEGSDLMTYRSPSTRNSAFHVCIYRQE